MVFMPTFSSKFYAGSVLYPQDWRCVLYMRYRSTFATDGLTCVRHILWPYWW